MDPGLVECNMHSVNSGDCININTWSYQHRNSHYKDKTVVSSGVVDSYGLHILSVPAWSKRFLSVHHQENITPCYGHIHQVNLPIQSSPKCRHGCYLVAMETDKIPHHIHKLIFKQKICLLLYCKCHWSPFSLIITELLPEIYTLPQSSRNRDNLLLVFEI